MNPSRQSGAKIRLMLVEDHVLVRMGVVSATRLEKDMVVVAEADDAQQAMDSFRHERPDVVIIDLRLPGMDGVELIKKLTAEFGRVRCIVLSSFGGGDDVNRALQAGALGYVMKGMPLDRLLEAVRTVHAGNKYVPHEIASHMKERLDSELSERELEVLRLIGSGMSNKQIAGSLGIVEGTVKIHVTNILEKLNAGDRTQAITFAIKRGILQLE